MPLHPDSPASALVIHRPDGEAGPWVFASPHSGTFLPADLGADPALDEGSLRSAEDVAMDVLARPGVALGAPLIACAVSRAYVDVNRAPDDLDPQVVAGFDPPQPVSARVQAGYGVIPRLTGDGRPIRATRLSATEAEGRIDRVHRPYHEALATLMTEAQERHGRATLIDWHSMPAGGSGGPDVVLGDRHASSCGAALTRRARAAFERRGWRVALNRPYAGGYATRLWGRPDEGVEALQIEISRGRYLDPTTGRPGPGFGAAQAVIRQVIEDLLGG
ncbi:N-formylglutamate amidohydrolase [Brevundimonas lutea]|uniref:N-formylglutamate amidohydrolase n=1 Tax=Brevundimonas lutea TaxID=2293980 RepID=UPI000F029099|nr:N-formylglutamate amidohydrolase [Brevundimonas lutea]